MRQRLVNEKAVNKTLAFLQEVYNISFTPIVKPLSLLYAEYHLSKSTGTVCKQLNIFSVKDNGGFNWIAPNAPNREIAIQVLEVLRRRNDKVVTVPLAGFEDLIAHLGELVNTLKPADINGGDITHQPKDKMLHRALNQAEMGGNNLFSQADKKQSDLIKIVAGITSGMYRDIHNASHDVVLDIFDKQKVSNLNDAIIFAANDLLTKIYK